LAIEVLSEGNTPREMSRKVREYFLSEVRLVWLVDPRQRTVAVYTAPDESAVFDEGQTLEGGDVLPGLSLPVQQVFAEVPAVPAAGKQKKAPRRRKKVEGGH
jgi:Uma2 family endonuclease